jgi:hypothetical protein
MNDKILFWRKIFVDKNGTYTGFRWWWRWTNAKRHWYQWLIYEGMPPHITDTDEMHTWNRNLIEMQDKLNPKP